jgi:hypothetical protein
VSVRSRGLHGALRIRSLLGLEHLVEARPILRVAVLQEELGLHPVGSEVAADVPHLLAT